ncbi:MAG: NYN domain-containing protein [Anaerolineaceae bacterium]|nr:NYN domain-containing protein [Anaerolineaceae bacterium]MDE0329151.1 NYN domain-containing protein [Anaerolineaceae bacterium]
MTAFLIVDVQDLQQRPHQRGIAVDLQELAVGLKGTATLVAGLAGPDMLRALAIVNPDSDDAFGERPHVSRIFRDAGYMVLAQTPRDRLSDELLSLLTGADSERLDEVILVTDSEDLVPLLRKVQGAAAGRIRVWGIENVLEGTDLKDVVIFQSLTTLPGLQQTRNVAVYIDFENITISLNEQGFTVNLDHLIERFISQANAYGQVVKMAAYAPWYQRGSLPPLVDAAGNEIADDAPRRLLMANIDAVNSLPGKNSADMRIARDVTTDAGHEDAADVYIVASGDRDFNDMLTGLRSRGKQVIVWSVRGSTSRQLESNPGIAVEYVEDFTNLKTHRSLWTESMLSEREEDTSAFLPSQWSSIIIQLDRLTSCEERDSVSPELLVEQLLEVAAVSSLSRGEDLVTQAVKMGILKAAPENGDVSLNPEHPIVGKTRLVTSRIVLRVERTLQVRRWEYVNYGFLIKGLAMDRELGQPGCNLSDLWRSDWIDRLVREQILRRELIPHRLNPEDMVPVISLRSGSEKLLQLPRRAQELHSFEWGGIPFQRLEEMEPETAAMVRRIIVSVEQFTSFRRFLWCPLGSLHKRLLEHDRGTNFQRAIDYLVANDAISLNDYPNPRSAFLTKGISLQTNSQVCHAVLAQRDQLVTALLALYDSGETISHESLDARVIGYDIDLWLSILLSENILNRIPDSPVEYSLFRTHHTVNRVANALRSVT